MSDISKLLAQLTDVPSEPAAFGKWLEMQDAISFLKRNIHQEEFIAYAGLEGIFIHALLVPSSELEPPNIDDLMLWNNNASGTWSIHCNPSGFISIEEPCHSTGSAALDRGTQLVFSRYFQGKIDEKHYFEILQEFVHVFDLHFLPERRAYCRLDKRGDIEDVVRTIEIPGSRSESRGTVIVFRRHVLDDYLIMTGHTIVRTFDFTRYSPPFGSWGSNGIDTFSRDDPGFFYRMHLEPGHASYMRGCQLAYASEAKEAVFSRYCHHYEEPRKYASFITLDWRHQKIDEISCAPGKTANYFMQSDLPFELSPAFFRPEVLSKYKADTEKYSLKARSIHCRGAWNLQTYDINEEDQVHTYLVYLRYLPYEEQLYWKAFNEPPKGAISKRAYTTDFLGSWDLDYDALESLRESLRAVGEANLHWWTPRPGKLLDQVHYPVTASPDEWANELLQLDQLLNEGFKEKSLRSMAVRHGRNPAPGFRSLKLIEECLIAGGASESNARLLVSPLRLLHDLRSKLKGHASGQEALKIRQQAIAEHGSLKAHFRKLCEDCDRSFKQIEIDLSTLT
jgi:hypothetical protein